MMPSGGEIDFPQNAAILQERHASRRGGCIQSEGVHLACSGPIPLDEPGDLRLLVLPFQKERNPHIEPTLLPQIIQLLDADDATLEGQLTGTRGILALDQYIFTDSKLLAGFDHEAASADVPGDHGIGTG